MLRNNVFLSMIGDSWCPKRGQKGPFWTQNTKIALYAIIGKLHFTKFYIVKILLTLFYLIIIKEMDPFEQMCTYWEHGDHDVHCLISSREDMLAFLIISALDKGLNTPYQRIWQVILLVFTSCTKWYKKQNPFWIRDSLITCYYCIHYDQDGDLLLF